MEDNTRTLALLRRLPLWQDLTEDELVEITRLVRYVTLSRGERISLEGEAGEALFIVAEGLVKLLEQSRGGEITLGIFGADCWLDELALFAPIFGQHSLEALTSIQIAKLEKSVLEDYLQSRPRLAWQLLENVARLASQRNPITLLYNQSLQVRLARYLIGLAQHRGIISPGGLIIDYPLQVADIQAAIGAREGEMVQALRSLVAQDVLDLTERLVITSLDQLKALAYGQDGADFI